MKKSWFPETYISVYWVDGIWSWENRDGLRKLIDERKPLKADIILYQRAAKWEAKYREALTGVRPNYPMQVTQNMHWRNTNAANGAYYSIPRARKNKKVTGVVEEDLDDEDIESEEEENESEVESEEESVADIDLSILAGLEVGEDGQIHGIR
jgi:hypothetical protein